jgi:RNA polymerase sigma-70 factor (ECF subfamily)
MTTQGSGSALELAMKLDLRRKLRDRRHRVLLVLAARGNEDSFRRLYRELFDPVSRFVQRRVPNDQDAEDITAQVFGTLVRRLDRYDPQRGSVMTWVVTMARNAVIDHYRRRRPDTESVDDLAELLAGAQPTPLQSMVHDDQLLRVQRRLARQPADIREMFALRFEQGLRVREVAEVMGLSQEAAKQRFARAFRKIQLELKDEEEGIGSRNKEIRKGKRPCAETD